MAAFVRVCALEDVADGTARSVLVDGTELAIVRSGDEVFAIRDECSHAAIPLSQGDVEGAEIECWLHGSRFDLRTGKAINLPATEPVPVFPCTTDGADILVDVSNPTTDHS